MSPQQNARLQRLLAEAIADTSIEYRLDLQLRISRIVDQAEPLQVEDLHAGVVAWFAAGRVDGEDFLITRMRAAIGAAVSKGKALASGIVDDTVRRRDILQKLHTVADHIEAAHPNGVETTLRFLREARDMLAKGLP